MPIPISYPGCKATYNVGDDLIGKRVRCKRRQQVMLVQARTKTGVPKIVTPAVRRT